MSEKIAHGNFINISLLAVGLVLLLANVQALGAPAHSLTVGEGFVNPIGFHNATPVFSWKLPDGVKRQTAYRIQTKAGKTLWDSGWIRSEQSTLVPYGGAPLTSREQVEWRIRFRDEKGKDSGWSEPARFELGLLSAKDWKAQWIRPRGESDPNVEDVSWLRRQFSLDKKPARARVYVTARGLFEFQLNGARVGDDHFANGWTSYHKRLDTLTYDVTRQLRDGDNTIEVMLGAAYYARSAQLLADSARVLKRDDDAKRYADEAAAVKQAFFKHYFDADGKLRNAPETQTAYLLAIAFDLVPREVKEKVAAHLVRLVAEADGHLRTGFLGTPYVVSVLDQTGHHDLAFELLFKETYPSWFYPINQGATTMWERWNSYTRDKGFGDVSMNSFNHYAYGAIGQWMYERVAGLTPDPANPGYKHFFVRPLVGKQLDSARAELETPYGRASSAWVKRNGKVTMDVVVPPNTTATIEFPDQRKPETLAAGTYHFELSQSH